MLASRKLVVRKSLAAARHAGRVRSVHLKSTASFLQFALLALAALMLGGCVRPGGRVAQGNHDQVLYWGNGSEPADLDPQTTIGEPESHIFNALFEGLVSMDPKDLHPVPGVAETWDVSSDGRVYTFHLRHNARWSNGDALTARDFIESYRRILSPALGAQYAEMFFNHVEVVNAKEFYDGQIKDFAQVGFQAPDPYTLVVNLKNPAAYFLQICNHNSWYPVHIPTILKYGKFDEKSTAWTHPGNFVGNGPFRLKAWHPQQDVVVERDPNYWDAANVRLKEIRYLPTENVDTEERDFRSGQLHITYEVPLSKVDVYRKKAPEVLVISPYNGTYYYRLNVTNPILKDKRVRRALAMAIDRDGIVKNVTRGGQEPAHCLTPPDRHPGGYVCRAGIPTDYAEARRLLAEAGYPDGRGLPPVELLINTSQNHRAVAEVVQQTWRDQLHVDARIVNQEWKVYLDSQHQLNYCTSRSSWIGDYIDPFTFLGLMLSDGGNNDTGFKNEDFDTLVRHSREVTDPAERLETLQKAEAILLDEAPVAPIYFWTRVYLRQPSVKGWYDNIQDRHMPKSIYLEDTAPAELPQITRKPGEHPASGQTVAVIQRG